MESAGRLKTELELKAFVLFTLRHFDKPLDGVMLLDVTMDFVIDRFDLMAALNGLVVAGQVTRTGGDHYALTQDGAMTLESVTGDIPASVRRSAKTAIERVKRDIELREAVRCEVVEAGGSHIAVLGLEFDGRKAVEIRLECPTPEAAERALRAWKREGYAIYRDLLRRLD